MRQTTLIELKLGLASSHNVNQGASLEEIHVFICLRFKLKMVC